MNRRPLRLILFAALALVPSSAVSIADTVVLTDRPPFEHVRVTAFRDGRLTFLGVSGEMLRKRFDHVERIALDADPDLSAAESARTLGQTAHAIDQYRRVADRPDAPWTAEWARWRLVAELARSDRFRDAVEIWLEVIESPAGGSPPRPMTSRQTSPAELRDAQQLVRAVAMSHKQPTVAMAAAGFWLDLVLLSGDELPPELVAVAGAPASSRPATASEPSDKPPLLFGEVRPTSATPVMQVALPLDSLTIRAALAAADAADFGRARTLLDRARPFVPPADDAAIELIELRCETAVGDPSAALERLLVLAEGAAAREIQSAALYHAALAAERLHRPEEALRAYRRLLARDDLSADLRTRAAERVGALSRP